MQSNQYESLIEEKKAAEILGIPKYRLKAIREGKLLADIHWQ